MDPISAISTGYAALTHLREAINVVMGAKVDAASLAAIHSAMQKLSDVQDSLFSAQAKLFELQSENKRLADELAESQSWESKASRYTLVKTDGEAVVYASNVDPTHYCCPVCFDRKAIGILQNRHVASGDWHCPACKATYQVSQSTPINFAGIGFT